MANLNQKIARIDVLIGGADQAKKELDGMKEKSAGFAKKIAEGNKLLADLAKGPDAGAYDRKKKEIDGYMKEQKNLQRSIRETERNINTVEKVLNNMSGQTLQNLNQTKSTLTKLLKEVDPKDIKGLEAVRDLLRQVTDEAQRRRGAIVEFSDAIGDIGNVSDKSLSMVKQRLTDLLSSTKLNSQEIARYRAELAQVEAEEQRRLSRKTGAVMGNLSGSSLTEIQDAIKATEQLRNAQKLGSQEWEIYNEEIIRAKKYLEDYNKLEASIAMSDRMKDLATVSTSSLEEIKKYWSAQVDGAKLGSQELEEYKNKLQEVQAEEQRRSRDKTGAVMGDLRGSSLTEIQDAIKATEQLRNTQKLGSQEWSVYNEEIVRAKKYLEDYNKLEASIAMSDRMKDLATVSTSSLEEIKKYWSAQVDGAKLGSQELEEYKNKLQEVQAEEQRRISTRAQSTLSKVQTDTFDGTIAQTKEAIKQLEQFKQQLKTSDVTGIKEVDDAILLLNGNLKQASTAAMSYDQAIEQAAQVKNGNFRGTYEDLERLRKTLQEYKTQLKVGDTAGLQKIKDAFKSIEEAEKRAKGEAVDVNRVLQNLKTAPMNDLKLAAAQLQEELNAASRETEDFIKKSAELRNVNKQIESVNKSWKEQEASVDGVMKKFTSYLLMYVGFNEVISRVRQLTQANLELSDSLTDIQKTTGLSAEAVGELSREIDKLDTRTSQKELHDLAYEAGKLGISAEQDVLQFVKAGNQLIAALGEDLGGAEAVRGLMKINDLLGETTRLGVEKALLSTGSALNEISQTSTASAGPISEIVSRLGAVGSQAKLSMADLIALGGVADELSQEVESSGTALSKFVTAMQTNTRGIAQAVGVDEQELQKMMDAGQTMEAMILVLERIKGMGGLKEISPIMKEFGSDGERLGRVITAFAANIDTLKKRVDTSRTAFEEATSVTNEYNVKNESAMALVQRLGNMMTESFVNSKFVGGLKNILQFFIDLPNWIDRNRASFVALKIVLTEILLLLAANNWGTFLSVLKSTGAFIAGPFIAGWKALRIQIVAAELALSLAGKSTVGLAGGFRVLWTIIKANPMGLLLTVIAAVGVATYELATYVSDAAKATAAFDAEMIKEEMRLDALFSGLKKNNLKLEERISLVNQINTQYSDYLGFMLSEKDSADKLAAAHDLINGKIRERIALSFKQKATERAEEKYGTKIQESLVGMYDKLESAPGVTSARSQEAASVVQDIVLKNISAPMDDILAMVKTELERKFNSEEASYGSSLYFDMQSNLKQFVNARKDYQKELAVTDTFIANEMKKAHEEVSSSGARMLNTITEEYNALKNLSTEGFNEGQLAEHNAQMAEKAKQYIAIGKKQMETVTGDQAKSLQTIIDSYTKIVADLTVKSGKQINVWGEGLSLETASVDQLVTKYKQLFDERKTMRDDALYDTVYSKQFTDRKEAMEWYLKELKIIQGQLNTMGYNEKGNFLKQKDDSARKITSGGVSKTVKEIREESAAALSALEAYYNQEKALITRQYTEREITEEEMNRRLLKKDEEFLTDRIALRRKLLGKQGGENFDQEKYVQTSPDTGETTQYFKGKNLDQLKGFINQMGQRMTDGMLQKLTEDELKIMQKAAEHMAKIQKIILDNDFVGQVDKQYQDELEALELFWGKEEDVTVEAGEKRLAFLRMLSKESYDLDSAGLQERMGKYGEFGEWMKDRTSEDYQALLAMLQKYYDDTEEAENREMQRKKRIAEKKWEKSGAEGAFNTADQQSKQNVGFVKNLNEIGLASDSQVDDAELMMYQNRLVAAQSYYDYLLQAGVDTTDAENARNEAMMELGNKEMEITMSKLEILKQYTDSVVEFGEQMGEAAFGEVSDRQAAAKQLLKVTMQITKNLIMEQIKRLLMQKTIGAQEVAVTQSVETAKTAAQGAGAITSLTVEGAKTAGDVALGTTSGAAKTIGQLGWWGIPLIAVISAALSALMGMAMGKMNKAKDEVAAATGVSNKGRVAAGMLTYADGDYPVLGNDGKVYNAAYQKDLKTGVYGGGAHFGIFSEKKPEMIVDGDTTQRLMLNYPQIYDSILTISRHGRLKAAMPTYAEGNYPATAAPIGGMSPDAANAEQSNARMEEMLNGLNETLQAVNESLKNPVPPVIDPYGTNGAVNQLGKARSFMEKRNLLKR